MNASSESGECASLISSAFVTASLVAMVLCPLNGFFPRYFRRYFRCAGKPAIGLAAPPDETPLRNWADSALRTSKFSAADARGTPAARGLDASKGPGRPKLARVAQSNASNNSARIPVRAHADASDDLQRRHHPRDRGVEIGFPVEVRLPESFEEKQIAGPSARIKSLTHRIGRVRAGLGVRGFKGPLDDLAGGVEQQGVPEVARDGFSSFAAFAGDGITHALGQRVRGLVE